MVATRYRLWRQHRPSARVGYKHFPACARGLHEKNEANLRHDASPGRRFRGHRGADVGTPCEASCGPAMH
eukprot:3683375-Prymnesium_polylepis.1